MVGAKTVSMQSGIIFQPCSLTDMPNEDTLVLGMTADNQAIIGCLWYDEENEVFICTSTYESAQVVKWAHIVAIQHPSDSYNEDIQKMIAFIRTKGGWGRNKGADEIMGQFNRSAIRNVALRLANFIAAHEKPVISSKEIVEYIQEVLVPRPKQDLKVKDELPF